MRRKKGFGIFLALAAVAFIATVALVSPLFQIRQIDIVGNGATNTEDILNQAQIIQGQNMLAFSASNVRTRINLLPHVKEVEVLREFPDRVIISITERIPVANIRVAHSGTYLLIDDAGMVLAARPQPTEGLPVAIGIDFANFAIGEYLDVESNIIFRDIIQLSRVFVRHNFSPDVVDMSNPLDIVLQTCNINILFGEMTDLDRKMWYAAAIIDQFETDDRGFIDIRDINIPPRFGLLR